MLIFVLHAIEKGRFRLVNMVLHHGRGLLVLEGCGEGRGCFWIISIARIGK